ncbi:hypothetical protein TREMEDRAFT_61833 [Tremella mesenterica DSM 1558]|uniref:uncharacterized protein n=1 Tax=Tremella mesenterica (strain ATCC 24925 / CBS 8224 / DSM 1558 / NBRC 9311 / NRRL Y-6157 / RJB 2259-6 / UBC 559-6) TaxID=578456 RepID=UPI0003F4A3E5|nr:uncharacterized protein TREMEDRAFT_61833 [Tremella mesenterica DSM 1558]EIW70071.1 hypothetical protein TREMEDRAFT_61833 [Tremella mesenterica DSM 1558]
MSLVLPTTAPLSPTATIKVVRRTFHLLSNDERNGSVGHENKSEHVWNVTTVRAYQADVFKEVTFTVVLDHLEPHSNDSSDNDAVKPYESSKIDLQDATAVDTVGFQIGGAKSLGTIKIRQQNGEITALRIIASTVTDAQATRAWEAPDDLLSFKAKMENTTALTNDAEFWRGITQKPTMLNTHGFASNHSEYILDPNSVRSLETLLGKSQHPPHYIIDISVEQLNVPSDGPVCQEANSVSQKAWNNLEWLLRRFGYATCTVPMLGRASWDPTHPNTVLVEYCTLDPFHRICLITTEDRALWGDYFGADVIARSHSMECMRGAADGLMKLRAVVLTWYFLPSGAIAPSTSSTSMTSLTFVLAFNIRKTASGLWG